MPALPFTVDAAPRVELRDYQRESIDTTLRLWRDERARRQLGIAATGLGKTVIFGALTAELGVDTLILAHRDELIRQAADKLAMIWPGAPVGIVKAAENDVHAPVVVASVQTLSRARRLGQLADRGRPFGLVIVDEAHHAAASSYRAILGAVGAGPGDDGWRGPRPLLLGVTATPDRGDRVGLDAVFDRVAWEHSMLWGIQSGFLSDLRCLRLVLDLDMRRVRVRAGDYADSDLSAALESAGAPGVAVGAYLQHAPGRRGLVFTPTVALARTIAETFLEHGIPAAYLSGETPDDERRRLLARFAAGELRILANCAVLTEGFDDPGVDLVIVARPTKSRALYVQMVGRGTRRAPGKPDCLVVDLVGVSADHDLVTVPDLFGLPLSALREGGTTIADAVDERDDQARRRHEVASTIAEEVALFDRKFRAAKLAWVEHRGTWILTTSAGFIVLEETEPGWWRAAVKPKGGTFRPLVDAVDLATAQATAEDHVRRWAFRNAVRNRQTPAQATALIRADAPWRKRPASDKQRAFADRLGVALPAGCTAGDAADLIDARKAEQALEAARAPVR